MLEIENVTVKVNDGEELRSILKNASLKLEAGKVTGLFGESGSGKSTLLSVAGLLLTPSSGDVFIGGESCGQLSQADKSEVRRENIGIIFQNSNLIPSLRVVDQLLLMREISGAKIDDVSKNDVSNILNSVGMGGYEKYYPSQLSGGQKQRVNIARALMNNPKILLADELTSALDSKNSEAVMRLIVDLTGEFNMSTLIITHDERYQKIVDERYFISDGVIE